MDDRVPCDIRSAAPDDLVAIVALLGDDPLGRQRENCREPLPRSYRDALDAIIDDPAHDVVVATKDGSVVGVLQLSVIPHLTYQGGSRGQVEGVRVASHERGRGIGRALLKWAVERARARGCHLVQLTTDRARSDARRFYEDLGFEATHDGMKLHL